MNWQTEEILEQARKAISDNGAFNPDQRVALEKFAGLISKAIDKESKCIGSGINHQL